METLVEVCPDCSKTPEFCLCSQIKPIDTKTQVLILRHPQEQDHELGTAPLAVKALSNATLRTGLSWPNLNAARFGKNSTERVILVPSEWAVLFLGSGLKTKSTPHQPLVFTDKKGVPLTEIPKIKGLIVIDGSWSQAKTLWWRNPWLVKLKRAIVMPNQKSLYGDVRREPKKECVSTLESLAIALAQLEGKPELEATLTRPMKELVSRYRRHLQVARDAKKKALAEKA